MLDYFKFGRQWCLSACLGLSLTIATPIFANDLDVLGQFLEQEFSNDDPIAKIATQNAAEQVSAQAAYVGPLLTSQSALIMNSRTGQVLYEKNTRSVRPIASISKLVSAMVVLDAKQDMNEPITITEAEIDRVKGTSSRLSVGTVATRRELLHLGLMSSENRAIHALARTYPGGMPAFLAQMNQKSRSLGMNNTAFYDPTGLDSRNVSTASDLALLVRAANQYPTIRQYSTANSGQLYTSRGRNESYRNSNALVREGTWNIQLQKTGYIRESGRSMVLHANVQGQPLIIVLLNSPSSISRVNDARNIQSWVSMQRPS